MPSVWSLCLLPSSYVALHDERYTWRHNSVLFEIQKFIQSYVADQNASVVKEPVPRISTLFVPAGKPPTKSKKNICSGLIAGSNDWKLLCDFPDSNYVFPPEVFPTRRSSDLKT